MPQSIFDNQISTLLRTNGIILQNDGTLTPEHESPYIPHSSAARDVNRLACKHITCIANK